MIRPATADDLAALVELEERCFGADAWSIGLLTGAIAADEVMVTDALDGYVAVRVVDDTADLDRVAVDPGRRRAGLGRTLVDEALAVATRNGASRMMLEVAADNTAALALYADRGFTEIHRRTDYYGHGIDAVVMEYT